MVFHFYSRDLDPGFEGNYDETIAFIREENINQQKVFWFAQNIGNGSDNDDKIIKC